MEIWNHGLLFGEDKIKINIKEFDAAWCVWDNFQSHAGLKSKSLIGKLLHKDL